MTDRSKLTLEEKRALLTRLMQEKAQQARAPFPLSPNQRAIWFIQMLRPEITAYHVPLMVRLRGHVDVDALTAALQALVERHDSLRMVFLEDQGDPSQQVLSNLRVALGVESVADARPERREEALQESARKFFCRQFDFARGPLVQARLFSVDEEDHALCVLTHHLVADGTSTLILLRDLGALYQAQLRRVDPSLPAAPSFRRLCHLPAARSAEELADHDLSYWRAALADVPPTLELPTDRPRPRRQSFSGDQSLLALDPALIEQVRVRCQELGVTAAAFYLACYAVLLSRLGGQLDFAVGMPVSGRTRVEQEAAVGMFVNILALRMDLREAKSLGGWAEQVQQIVRGALEHQDVPFERLVGALKPARDESRSPIFQVNYNMLNFAQANELPPGWQFEPMMGHTGARYDLGLTVVPWGGRVQLQLVFSDALFDRATANRFLEMLARIVARMAAAPETPIGSVELADSKELTAMSAPEKRSYPHHTLLALLNSPTTTSADEPAVVSGSVVLSRQQLEERSNALAHALLGKGCGRGARVGLLMERGADLVVGLLGILKAGAAYLPLDPTHPTDRWTLLLRDAGADHVVSEGALASAVAGKGFAVVTLGAIARAPRHRPAVEVTADDLAYVIYTSGSTGMPKGVGVTHGNLTNYVQAVAERLQLERGWSYATVSTIAADLGNTVVFPALCLDGTLHVMSAEESTDPELLAAAMERHPVDVLKIVPSHLTALLGASARPKNILPRRRLVCGGETLLWPLVERVHELAPGCLMFNHYGPTETTVGVACGKADLDAPRRSASTPLGRGLANTVLQVLDDARQPVPAGVVGELFIGGAQVAPGYLGRPELTAERFIPDGAGGRMYRTGDRARLLLDGTVEFLGRGDFQVKIRGYRIELGEVEAAMLRQPAVREAVAVGHEVAPGDRRLICYAVAAPGGVPPDASALQQALREQLPDYMVPSIVVWLDRIPLTANGKVDRRALPAPAVTSRSLAGTPPRGPHEQMLARIWSEVLHVEEVGRDANFFELGGDSILALQVVSRASRSGLRLSARDVFERRTLAELASAVRNDGFNDDERDRAAATDMGLEAPTTVTQERLWFIEQILPGRQHHCLAIAASIQGPLAIPRLEHALRTLLQRHEALRTVFRFVDGRVVQLVQPTGSTTLQVVTPDLTRKDAVETFLSAAQEAPFDLAAGPLLRAHLAYLGSQRYVLALVAHHLVADAASMGIALRDLCALYEARGAADRMPPLPMGPREYAVQERQLLASSEAASRLQSWVGRLRGLRPLELAAEGTRSATDEAARILTEFPAELAAGLEALADAQGASLDAVLLTGFAALLARQSGQEDIGIGLPILERPPALRDVVGRFTNLLALRVDCSGDPSFAQLVARAQEVLNHAHENQSTPFAQVVEALAPERRLDRHPLVQVTLSLSGVPHPQRAIDGLDVEELAWGGPVSSSFDLSVSLQKQETRLVGSFTFRKDLFGASRIEGMARHLQALLQSAVRGPDTALSRLALMGEEERQNVVSWGRRRRAEHRPTTLDDMFSSQAIRTPARVACEFQKQKKTFGELDAASDAIATSLRERGVGPGDRVAVAMDRSAEMLSAILGILRSGAAYLPLDPDFPDDRLSWQLRDAGVRVVLVDKSAPRWLDDATVAVLVVDGEWEARGSPGRSHGPFDADRVAYVMYTSGASGLPKGIPVSHRAACNHLLGRQLLYPLRPGDRVLSKASFGFDASVWEMFAPLAFGASVIMAPPGAHRDPVQLIRLIRECGVTVAQFGPGALRILLDTPGVGHCTSLRRIFCGGDALPLELQERFFKVLGGELVSQYGSTETAVDVALFDCVPGASYRHAPIGKPLPNVEVYILDSHGEPVPPGLIGELHVGGPGVTGQYLNQPATSAAAFCPNPFSSVPGARLYRTGDLARWLPDANLEFCGRADQQVKVRGFRLELTEVETTLRLHPAVKDAAVAVRADATGDRVLVGYVVCSTTAPTAQELRGHLERKLPAQMVPRVFVQLDTLPLTAQGKVDRKALPRPDHSMLRERARAARSPVEEALRGLFSDILGVAATSVADGFFELGGDSLTALELARRIRRLFGVDISLTVLFLSPTIEALASAVEHGLGSRPSGFTPLVSRDLVRLSYAQERLWFIEQLKPGTRLYAVPSAWRLRGALNPEALSHALSEVVKRHEMLRTTFLAIDGVPFQRLHPSAPVDIEVTSLNDGEVASWLNDRVSRPFDLQSGPLLRAHLGRIHHEDWVLLLNLHHIVYDGWSGAVLIREVSELYAAFIESRPPRLSPLPIQYGDYAVRQRQWLEAEELGRQLAWWKERMAGLPPLELGAGGRGPSDESERRFLKISPRLTSALKKLAQEEGATLYMAMLAAFVTLLSRYSGQDTIGVGTPIANRHRAEVENLIGFFVNTLVMRVDCAGKPSFREMLRRARETALAAYGHQDLPFEKLVECLNPERRPDRNPLFQAMLAMQASADAPGRLGDILMEPVDTGPDPAKFDLTLYLQERDGGVEGQLGWRVDIFGRQGGQVVIEQFCALLETVVAKPEAEVDSLPWSGFSSDAAIGFKAREFPPQRLEQLFEAQVAACRERPAIIADGTTWTYSQLDRRANELAAVLMSRGVGKGTPVPILAERSAHSVMALVAALKAGGVATPLDAVQPRARLLATLETLRSPVVVGARQALSELGVGERGVCWSDGHASHASAPRVAGEAHELAYIIHTSGSTGVPKGAELRHDGLVSLLHWMGEQFVLGPTDRFSFAANPSFDASLMEAWLALIHGGTLCIPDDATRADLRAWAGWLGDQGVTFCFMTTPLCEAFLAEAPLDGLSLRWVITGGDKLRRGSQRSLPFALINGYGPTETSVFCSWEQVEVGAQRPSIGRAVPNARVYLLDRALQPVPPGAAGEIVVGGVGVGRGYHDRPELTAERFVPDPFAADGTLMYRTGDRAWLSDDGRLHFIGRADAQLKIRGFRVEPAEVETQLRNDAAVRECAVVAQAGPGGDKQLAAYVVATAAQEDERSFVAELKARMTQRVPDYMVPVAWKILPSLPMTPNGKLDRNALPPADWHATDDARRLPASVMELELAEIWQRVLALPAVGPDDGFFELGGHSLLAMRLLAEVGRRFGVPLPVSALFEGPTVRQMSERIRRGGTPGRSSPLVPLRTEGTQAPLFLVHPVGGHVVCYAPLLRHLARGRPVYALRAEGIEDDLPPRRSIAEMAARYLPLISQAAPGPYAIAGWSFGGLVALEMARLLESSGAPAEWVGLLDSFLPPAEAPAPDELDLLVAVGDDLVRTHRGAPIALRSLLMAVEPSARLSVLLSEGIKAGGLPPSMGVTELTRLVNVYRCNLEARRLWRPAPVACPALLVVSEDTAQRRGADVGEAWRPYAPRLTIKTHPGDHFTIMQSPHVKTLAGWIEEQLGRGG
nr:condensation domain-containing protein [uncultured bacterium]